MSETTTPAVSQGIWLADEHLTTARVIAETLVRQEAVHAADGGDTLDTFRTIRDLGHLLNELAPSRGAGPVFIDAPAEQTLRWGIPWIVGHAADLIEDSATGRASVEETYADASVLWMGRLARELLEYLDSGRALGPPQPGTREHDGPAWVPDPGLTDDARQVALWGAFEAVEILFDALPGGSNTPTGDELAELRLARDVVQALEAGIPLTGAERTALLASAQNVVGDAADAAGEPSAERHARRAVVAQRVIDALEAVSA